MDGKIVNFRRGRSTAYPNQIIIMVESVKTKEEADKLIGKGIYWETPTGKKINGKISKVHGSKGEVIARLEKGLPGQAIGTNVKIA